MLAFEEGATAYYNNQERDENPYPPDTEDEDQWDVGWYEAWELNERSRKRSARQIEFIIQRTQQMLS